MAIVFIAVAVAATLLLDPVLHDSTVLLLGAILVTSRLGGRRPGLIATTLGVLAAWFFLIPYRYSFEIQDFKDIGLLGLLAACGVGISFYADGRRSSSELDGVYGEVTNVERIWRPLTFAGVVLVLVTVVAILVADDLREQTLNTAVNHTHEVHVASYRGSASLESAAMSQSMYLLTGDEEYLKQYASARTQIGSDWRRLRTLTQSDPAQQKLLDALDALVKDMLGQLDAAVLLRRQGDMKRAIAAIHSDDGKQAMDQCRSMLSALNQEEDRRLSHRSDEARMQALRYRWTLGMCFTALLVTLILAGTVIDREAEAYHQTNRALRRSEERLQVALGAAKAGTWEWNVVTNRRVWSEELWELYGLAPHTDQACDDPWLQAIHERDRAAVEQSLRKAAQDETEISFEFRVANGEGEPRWMLARAQPVRDPDGVVRRFIGVALEIAPRTQAEERGKRRAELY